MAWKNSRKNFSKSHEYGEQKNGGEKTREKFFCNHPIVASKKMTEKTRQNFFEESHEYRDQKNGGKNRAKSFL